MSYALHSVLGGLLTCLVVASSAACSSSDTAAPTGAGGSTGGGGGSGGAGVGGNAGGSGGSEGGSGGSAPGSCNEDNSTWTVGLKYCTEEALDGYTLFAPISSTTTYLIDIHGREVHSWPSSSPPGNSVYLMDDGRLLRTGSLGQGNNFGFDSGGNGGIVQIIEWDGSVSWDYEYASAAHLLHHDVELLPNGHILMVAWELKTNTEAIAAGRNPSTLNGNDLWPDMVIEVEPSGANGGTIVWEWHIWDHLIQDFDANQANYGTVADNPQLIDINQTMPNGNSDWNHVNSVQYNADLDQIVLSSHNQNEIWIIDHKTATDNPSDPGAAIAAAAGPAGDLLYRWGNPVMYGAGSITDKKLFAQHDAQWIDTGLPGAGHMLIFNNGRGRPGGSDYSSIEEIVLPVDSNGDYSLSAGSAFEPTAPTWQFVANPAESFYSDSISGAQRLANGNTLICEGSSGHFFEVTSDGQTVWDYVSPVTKQGVFSQGDDPDSVPNPVFRAYRYTADYPGLAGKDLTPGDYIELPSSG